ncbi:c-type cytochrome [Roseomonas gilardii subsp. gilardii]|uniref:c-type cytochrome n=1 Tax=Roseomonas gilardii TaxID=257708 RepID=UPI001FFA9CDB|nr:cytochrome c [Roseomonas gilardii]UPG70926.1 c-type cytochrome [Roseomonas gilardii subsp. gilardii]
MPLTPAALVALLFLALPAAAATLRLESGVESLSFDSDELLRHPEATEIEIATDPAYRQSRRYRAVPLASLLSRLAPPEDSALETVALDGYAAQIPLRAILGTGAGEGSRAWIAVEPAGAPWPPMPGKAAGTGPFYIVWERPEAGGIPTKYWTYQLAMLRYVASPTARWPMMEPDPGLPGSHPARRGLAVFIAQCLPCHRINGGGTAMLGPDLNRPMSPVEYFQPASLRRYLRDPASIRHWPDQKMPGFTEEQLPERDMESLIAYLAQMAAQRP